MNKPLYTLILLNQITVNLNLTEAWITIAREEAPNNQILQLEMDRRQNAVNERRSELEMAYESIASMN